MRTVLMGLILASSLAHANEAVFIDVSSGKKISAEAAASLADRNKDAQILKCDSVERKVNKRTGNATWKKRD